MRLARPSVCPSVCPSLLLLRVFCCSNSRSMTPITWQAAVDDEEQRPLLQDILEAAVDDRRLDPPAAEYPPNSPKKLRWRKSAGKKCG